MNTSIVIANVIHSTPVWVWFVLAAVIVLGLQRTQARTVTVSRIVLLPLLMFVMMVSSVFTTTSPDFVLPVFAVALAVGAGFGNKLGQASGARAGEAPGTIRVEGEWWSLALVLGAFVLHYAFNVVEATDAALAASDGFVLVRTLLLSALGGIFAGRAATVVWLGTRPVSA